MCPETAESLTACGTGGDGERPRRGSRAAAGAVSLLPTAGAGVPAGSGTDVGGTAHGQNGFLMSAGVAAQAQKENAPPKAWGHGAAVGARQAQQIMVCLVCLGRLWPLSGHEQASYFNAWLVGAGRDAALEVARIYFPQ